MTLRFHEELNKVVGLISPAFKTEGAGCEKFLYSLRFLQ